MSDYRDVDTEREMGRNFRAALEKLRQQLGRRPTAAEMSDYMKKAHAKVQTDEAVDTAVKKPAVSRTQTLKDKGVTPWWIKQKDDGNWASYPSSNDEKEKAKEGQGVGGPYLSKVDADKHVKDKQDKIRDKEREKAAKPKTTAESTMKSFLSFLIEAPTRQDFRMVADLIKANPDAKKRKELAMHHAKVFSQQNPRFDAFKFYTACNVPVSSVDQFNVAEVVRHKPDPKCQKCNGTGWAKKQAYGVAPSRTMSRSSECECTIEWKP